MAEIPVIDITGTYNFRSTGGYVAQGGSTRADGLFRSDALHRLDEAGQTKFAELGISRIIDLRYEQEIASQPNSLPAGSVEIVHQPIFDAGSLARSDAAGLSAENRIPSLAELYRMIATDRAEALAAAVRLIADAPEGGVLVHCTAGKDRTGMVVAAALTVVGVSREQVIADYAATAGHLAGEWAEEKLAAYAAHMNAPVNDAVRELVTASPAGAIAEGLDAIDAAHGSTEQLLRDHGFDDAALERLRTRLVA